MVHVVCYALLVVYLFAGLSCTGLWHLVFAKKCKLHVYLWEVISAFKWVRKRDGETHSNYRCEPMDLDPSPCDQRT